MPFDVGPEVSLQGGDGLGLADDLPNERLTAEARQIGVADDLSHAPAEPMLPDDIRAYPRLPEGARSDEEVRAEAPRPA